MLKLALVLLLSLGLVSCLKGSDFSPNRDRGLFIHATNAMEHNQFDVAVITFQTLINTYPDSGYAAMAKYVLENDPRLADCHIPPDMNIVFGSDDSCLGH